MGSKIDTALDKLLFNAKTKKQIDFTRSKAYNEYCSACDLEEDRTPDAYANFARSWMELRNKDGQNEVAFRDHVLNNDCQFACCTSGGKFDMFSRIADRPVEIMRSQKPTLSLTRQSLSSNSQAPSSSRPSASGMSRGNYAPSVSRQQRPANSNAEPAMSRQNVLRGASEAELMAAMQSLRMTKRDDEGESQGPMPSSSRMHQPQPPLSPQPLRQQFRGGPFPPLPDSVYRQQEDAPPMQQHYAAEQHYAEAPVQQQFVAPPMQQQHQQYAVVPGGEDV